MKGGAKSLNKFIDNIFDALKKQVDEAVGTIKIADNFAELKVIDEVIKELNIKVLVPKNTLTINESFGKINNIIKVLKAKKPPKIFDPDKAALKKMEIKLPVSQRGASVDFAGTAYLYPVSGNQKNIVKIKLTGSRKNDDKLAYKLSGVKKNKNYTWHHLDDYDPVTNTCSMQLVELDIHVKTCPHYGSVELAKQFFNLKNY